MRRIATAVSVLAFAAVVSAGAMSFVEASEQGASSEDKGSVLVARRGLLSPSFQESVVLMLPAIPENPLVVGLIINKPTRVTLGEIFPDDPALKDRTEPIYYGGPVEVNAPSVIFRSTTAYRQATRVVGDVYVSFDADFVQELVSVSGRERRVFLGRSQWAHGQVDKEMLRGSWYSMMAESGLIFDPNPERVWPLLVGRADVSNVVRLNVPPSMHRLAFTAPAQQ